MDRPLQSRPRAVSSGLIIAVFLLTVAGTILWLTAIFLAPYLAARGDGQAARLIYGAFSPVCHQIPERSFLFRGYPLAVCGRCLGIYVGFAAGLALYPLLRGFRKLGLPSARLIILATIPMALDAIAGILGIWASPMGVRFATGIAWGTLLPFCFVTGVADLLISRKERLKARALEKETGET